MFRLISILVIAILIAWFEIPNLWRQKLWKELVGFLLVFISGVILNVLVELEIPLPNPFNWIIFLFNPINEKLLHLLQLQ